MGMMVPVRLAWQMKIRMLADTTAIFVAVAKMVRIRLSKRRIS